MLWHAFRTYQGYANQWNSFNPGIANIDFTGSSEAMGVGDTNIEGCVERTIWYNWGGGYCEPFTDLLCDDAPVEVNPTISGPHTMWWFKGENPPGYATQSTLSTEDTGNSYLWSVVSGGSKVILTGETAASAGLTSNGMSNTQTTLV